MLLNLKKKQSMVEKEFDGSVEVLYTNNGGKYFSNAFVELFKREGI